MIVHNILTSPAFRMVIDMWSGVSCNGIGGTRLGVSSSEAI